MKKPFKTAVIIIGAVLVFSIGVSIGRAENHGNSPSGAQTSVATKEQISSSAKQTEATREYNEPLDMDIYNPSISIMKTSGTGDNVLKGLHTETFSVFRLKKLRNSTRFR